MLQRTDEWYSARCGSVTASRIKDVMAKGQGKTRRNYLAQLVAERMTGVPAESFTSAAMERGTLLEDDAITCYEFETGHTVEKIGFVPHPTIEWAGASPDGLIGEDGLCECKVPNTSTHIDYLLSNKVPTPYYLQIQFQLACTERKWCDFVSYDPRLGIDLQLLIIRVERDDAKIEEIEKEVSALLAEVDETVKKLRELRN